MIKKLYSLIHFFKWTDCNHHYPWKPTGFVDWKCTNCGAETDNPLEAERLELEFEKELFELEQQLDIPYKDRFYKSNSN